MAAGRRDQRPRGRPAAAAAADHRKHRCADCGKTFARSDNLATHRRLRHDVMPVKTARSRRQRAPRPETVSDQPLQQQQQHAEAVEPPPDEADQHAAIDPPPPPPPPPDDQPPAIEPHADDNLFRVYSTEPRQNPLYGLEEVSYFAHITPAGRDEVALDDGAQGTVFDVLLRALHRMITVAGHNLRDDDLIQLRLSNPASLDYPIFIPPTEKKDLTVDLLTEHLVQILQSNEQFDLGELLLMEVLTIRIPRAGRNSSRQHVVEEKWLKNSSSMVIITNDDRRCLARAVVVALGHLLHGHFVQASTASGQHLYPPKPRWCLEDSLLTALWKRRGYEHVRRREPRQLLLAQLLIATVGFGDDRCGVAEWRRMQDNYLSKFGIRMVVFSRRLHSSAIFHGPANLPRSIYLYYNDERRHVDVVLSPLAFVNRNYFCAVCLKAYNNAGDHRFEVTCWRCQGRDKPACVGELRRCDECLRWFAGDQCFLQHQQLKTCQRRRYCRKCSAYLADGRAILKHVCGHKVCRKCHVLYRVKAGEDHLCFMQPLTANRSRRRPKNKGGAQCHPPEEPVSDDADCAEEGEADQRPTFRYVVWDSETSQSFDNDSPRMTLSVNCVAARMVCSLCQKLSANAPCTGCGLRDRDVCFYGTDAMDRFCRWLVEGNEVSGGGGGGGGGGVDVDDNEAPLVTTCFAHNLKGFDAFPLLRWMYAQKLVPDVIMTGRKVMSIALPVYRLRFLDSLCYLPMPLKAIPKAMGLSTQLRKGDFPHRLNRVENQGRSWPHHPPLSYYDPDSKSETDREALERWHAEVSLKPFVFDRELQAYCRNDVAVLLQGVLAFRAQFMEMTIKDEVAPRGVDPFASNITIAGACNRVFRQLFLKPDTVGLIPSNGYRPNDVQSLEAIRWLMYLNETEPRAQGSVIRHARNGGEARLPGIGKVDGYREKDGVKWVYEFHVSIKVIIFIVNMSVL